ncbi:MAG: thiamine pyrophosphate-dependent enzyme, partial [Muribaculaceae bacterium]
ALTSRSNIAVLADVTSGLQSDNVLGNIGMTLRLMRHEISNNFRPDYVITCGGSIVDQYAIELLKNVPGLKHISVNAEGMDYDSFGCLEKTIQSDYITLFEIVVPLLKDEENRCTFHDEWTSASRHAYNCALTISNEAPWSQMKAMQYIIQRSDGTNLQLGNGMTVRYAQFFENKCNTVMGNRGVSGIDGSISTAIGAAIADKERTTLLLIGDMGFQYDMGALACNFIPDNLKIVVMNNAGGGIFRLISNTRNLPVMEQCLASITNVPVQSLAAAYGFRYFKAESFADIELNYPDFINFKQKAILELTLQSEIDNKVFNNYISIINGNENLDKN